jgi:hypothetical protein
MSVSNSITGTWINPAHLKRCEGKVKYRAMSKAAKKAEIASYREGALIHAYPCPDCGYYHIGHADISQQMARLKPGETLEDLKTMLQSVPPALVPKLPRKTSSPKEQIRLMHPDDVDVREKVPPRQCAREGCDVWLDHAKLQMNDTYTWCSNDCKMAAMTQRLGIEALFLEPEEI